MLVLAECRLVAFKAKAAQPRSKVHNRRALKTSHKASLFQSKGLSGAGKLARSAANLDFC